ncbi:MAG TPA: MFS transporter [Caulobacteraceae bacterium]|jgi:GPH family glycoside/pentoside/hexuronide:cation symporter
MTELAEFDTLVSGPAPPADIVTAPRAKLGFGTLAFYGAGALVENATTPVLALLLFYLSALCGLSAPEAGLIAGLTLVVDACCDPLVGSISDNSRSRHGRRHPFMLLALVPIALAIGLLFSAPAGLSGGALFVFALVILFAARIALSFFIVPYTGLGAELSDDYAERSTIVASRVVFSLAVGLVMAILSSVVFLGGPHGQYYRPGYTGLAWCAAAIALVGGLVSTLGTLGARGRLHQAPTDQRRSLADFPVELVECFRNRSFRWLFITCWIFFVSAGVAGALTLYANSYFWHLFGRQLLPLGLVALPGGLFGVFVAGAIARRVEKRTAAMIGLGLIAAGQGLPVTLRLTGLIPLSAGIVVLCVATAVAICGSAIALIGFQSMMADAADEHEHMFFARREGLYFAGITTSAKASSGIGAFIAGIALKLIGFPAGSAAAGAAAHIPPDTIRNLGLVYGPGAAICTIIAICILFGYRLDRAGHARIRGELDQRRAAT